MDFVPMFESMVVHGLCLRIKKAVFLFGPLMLFFQVDQILVVYIEMLRSNVQGDILLLKSFLEIPELKEHFRVQFVEFGLGDEFVCQVVFEFFGDEFHLSKDHGFLIKPLLRSK